jgi:mannitol 2-dehydrogenase
VPLAQRLSSKTLKNFTAPKGGEVEIPNYDRSKLKPGHIHFGFANFFPALTALKTHQLLQSGDRGAFDYGIVGVNIHRSDRSEQINSQDGLYTLFELDAAGKNKMKVVGSVIKFLFAPKNPQAIYDLVAAPETRIISFTITPNMQHAYRNADGNLNLDHPDIQNDLVETNIPKTVMGYIVRGFRLREQRNLPGFTVMNLDNLEHNGDVIRNIIRQFAAAYDASLAAAIDSKLAFPNSMVDRIVPKTTPELLAKVAERLGLEDVAAIPAEPVPSISWALEGKKFINGRPAWEKLGLVKIADDVAPFEKMKLRLLNASRFGVAHLGDLKGFKIFDDAANDPLFREFMLTIMKNETEPTLDPLLGVNLDAYEKELIDRCANNALRDILARTLKEGPIKNVLNVARDQLKMGLPIDLRALSVAAWMRRCRVEQNEVGGAVVFEHPMAEVLKQKALKGGNDPSALFGVTEVFGDIGKNQRFFEAVGRYLKMLDQPNGVDKAVRTAIAGSRQG